MRKSCVTIVDTIIRSINWADYEVSSCPAEQLGVRLTKFIDPNIDQENNRRDLVENHVFSEDDIFSGTESSIWLLVRIAVKEPALAEECLDILDMVSLECASFPGLVATPAIGIISSFDA